MPNLIDRTILISEGQKPIRLEYSDNNTYFGDTAVTIYDDYKISLVLTDDCGAVIGDKVFFPKRGDMVLFRPDEVHFGRFPQSSAYKFISFLIPVDLFHHHFPQSRAILDPFLDTGPDRVNLIRLPEPWKSRLIDLAEELLQLLRQWEEPGFDLLAFAKLAEALGICSRCYPLQKALPPPAASDLVTKTMQQMELRFPESAALEELAAHCGCSVTYLTQTFRRYTGKSIHQYLTQRRLEQARRLLQKGASVTEACYRSGFSDCSAFIAQFKRQFGITPGKYKRA